MRRIGEDPVGSHSQSG